MGEADLLELLFACTPDAAGWPQAFDPTAMERAASALAAVVALAAPMAASAGGECPRQALLWLCAALRHCRALLPRLRGCEAGRDLALAALRLHARGDGSLRWRRRLNKVTSG